MKVGDKLFCITNYYTLGYNGYNPLFRNGYEYEINNIFNNAVFVSYGKGEFQFIRFYSDSEKFSEHFLTLKEYRNIKLNKIYENR